MGVRPALASIFVAAFVSLVAMRVRADATSEAAQAYDEGARAYDAKDYARAARAFALADERAPTGRALELAMAAALLSADESASLGMDLVVRAERRAVDGTLAKLAKELRARTSSKVGRVVLVCARGHTCRGEVDGRALTPELPRHAPAGRHSVRITNDDGTTSVATVDVSLDAESKVEVPAPELVSPPRVVPSEPAPSGLHPAFFGVTAGVTLVGAAVAAGLTVHTGNLYADFRAAPSQAGADAGRDAQTAARIAWGASAALFLGSVVLFSVTSFRHASARVALGPGQVHLVGRF